MIVYPPSTGRLTPVIQATSSLARNKAARATSSVDPIPGPVSYEHNFDVRIHTSKRMSLINLRLLLWIILQILRHDRPEKPRCNGINMNSMRCIVQGHYTPQYVNTTSYHRQKTLTRELTLLRQLHHRPFRGCIRRCSPYQSIPQSLRTLTHEY